MYTNYLSILSLFWKISCHCFTICHTFCAFNSFNRHQQLLYIVASILFYSNLQLAAGFFSRCHFMYVYVCVGFALKSFILVFVCTFMRNLKTKQQQKKYIRIFRLALSFGFYRTAMMMEMQMRWHNHSNLIHSIDLKQNLFETKDLCATQFDMQMKIYQSMFLNCTVMYRIKGQRNGIYIDCELLFHLYYKIHFVVDISSFFSHLIVLCATRKIHCIQWLNLWFMDFI